MLLVSNLVGMILVLLGFVISNNFNSVILSMFDDKTNKVFCVLCLMQLRIGNIIVNVNFIVFFIKYRRFVKL